MAAWIEHRISSVPPHELEERRNRIIGFMAEKGIETMVFFSGDAIIYLSDVELIPTERPVALLLRADGQMHFFVPLLEREHVESRHLGPVTAYPEYPDEIHPIVHLGKLIQQLGWNNAGLAADRGGYPGAYGYQGPSLSSVLGTDIPVFPTLIQSLRVVKSPYELSLIRESARWSNLALKLLQERTHPGLTEQEVVPGVEQDAYRTMLKTLGDDYVPTLGNTHVSAGYRGQIGKQSFHPHELKVNSRFSVGDILGASAGAKVGGYSAELERCFFLGAPSAVQTEYYHRMEEIHQLALETIRPGIPCSDVDRAVRNYYRSNGLEHAWRHHTGHALGFGMHEAPFLDVGDHTIIQPGMVFSIEPGIYIPEVGGLRLSDTIAVHADGIELVTYYSRKLEDMVIPV